jgi:hypothetical protein
MEDIFNIIIRTFGAPKKKNILTGQISVDCPVCDSGHHKGNLEINIAKNIYSCWACRDNDDGVKGRDLRWLIKKYGCLDDFKYYNDIYPNLTFKTLEKSNEEVVLPLEYKRFSKRHINQKGYEEALNYLLERGLSEEIIQKYHIGFCSDGKYSGRIIIPSFDMFRDLNYFIGRDYTGNNKLKYYNHTNQKQDIIFNEYFINWDASLFLVEGVFDHIVTYNSIPILGKTISKKLIVNIQKNLKGNLYIALDGDALDSAIALKKQLDFGNIKDKVYLVVLPKDEDLSSLYQKNGAENYYNLLRNYILK